MNTTWIPFAAAALGTLISIARRLPIRHARVSDALGVEHFPNPTASHTSPDFDPAKQPFPYAWYYRTEVTNKLDRPLKIVRFESYLQKWGLWLAANILRRPLTTETFLRWYEVDDGTQDGWLPPGAKAVCAVNWHGFQVPYAPKAKWVFYAVDEQGNKYQSEGEIISIPYSKDEVTSIEK